MPEMPMERKRYPESWDDIAFSVKEKGVLLENDGKNVFAEGDIGKGVLRELGEGLGPMGNDDIIVRGLSEPLMPDRWDSQIGMLWHAYCTELDAMRDGPARDRAEARLREREIGCACHFITGESLVEIHLGESTGTLAGFLFLVERAGSARPDLVIDEAYVVRAARDRGVMRSAVGAVLGDRAPRTVAIATLPQNACASRYWDSVLPGLGYPLVSLERRDDESGDSFDVHRYERASGR